MEASIHENHTLYSHLREAVQNRDDEAVAHLLTHHPDVSIAERVDAQKLVLRVFRHAADDLGLQASIVKVLTLLLDRGADVNVADTAGRTALHLAVASRMTQVIDFLISRGANLQARDKTGNFILHFLIESEYRKVKKYHDLTDAAERLAYGKRSGEFIRWMVSKAADTAQCKNEREETALHLAAKYGLLSAVAVLLEYTRKARRYCNDRYMTAFQIFIESIVLGKLVDTFTSCVDDRFYTNVRTGNTGIVASYFESAYAEKICERFLSKKFSVDVIDESKSTPLHHALKQRSRRFAKLMLSHVKKVDVRDDDGNTALNVIMNYCEDKFYKFGKEDEEMIRVLVSKGANIHAHNKNNTCPLITAVRYRKLAVLKIFQETGTTFCHSQYDENLLFHFFKSKVEADAETFHSVFDLLVSQGCDVNAKDVVGLTPLHFAARLGKPKIVERLIESKVDVNFKESIRKYTPLHEAIVHKCLGTVKLLINSGADVNAKTFKGQRALHLLDNGIEGAVELLVRKNAHLDVMDHDGFLPLQLAILRQNDRVIEKLLRFGADINDTYIPALGANDYAVSKLIAEHLIRLKVAKQPIDEKLKAYLESGFYTTEIYERCRNEIESLKKYDVNDFTSLYDLLHMNRNFMCTYVKNKKLKELIDSPTFEQQFPMYHGLISAVYFMAHRREKLLEPARAAWLELTNISLPYLCIYEILSYLSNVNLRLMTKKTKSKKCEKASVKKLT